MALRNGYLLPAALLFWGCGTARMAEREPPPDGCKARVEENAYITGAKPDKAIKNPRAGYGRCFSEWGMMGMARQLACDSGYALVSLINVRKPGFMNGPCYQADLEFYRSDSGARVSETPILKYDTISPLGLQAIARLNIGGLTRGMQAHTGLVTDAGDTARTERIAAYLGLRYFFLPYLGVEGETGGSWGSANAPKAKAMDFTRAWDSKVGLSLIPWQTMILSGRWQTALSGGMSYTRLVFADDFKDFLAQNASFILTDEAASGWGWYAGGHVREISRLGFLGEIGLSYSAEYPKFPAGTKAFSGKAWLFDAGLGYRF